jgi:adenosine deaminase
MGLSFRDIKSIVMAGFKSSFLPFHERQAYLRRVGQELARFDDAGNPISTPSPSTPAPVAHERVDWPQVTASASAKN